jgi:hypothetical protein
MRACGVPITVPRLAANIVCNIVWLLSPILLFGCLKLVFVRNGWVLVSPGAYALLQ